MEKPPCAHRTGRDRREAVGLPIRRHAGCMTSEEQLRARLRKLEVLFAGATTPGERVAAEAALGRIKARLAEARRTAPAVELQFSIADP